MLTHTRPLNRRLYCETNRLLILFFNCHTHLPSTLKPPQTVRHTRRFEDVARQGDWRTSITRLPAR